MSETSSSTKSSKRQLRERKQKKLYSEWALLGDDYEGDGIRKFSVAEKLESPKFAQPGMVREMRGSDLSVAYLQQYGFNIPLLFKEKTGLGLRVPSANFSIRDVRTCVGSRRVLDVMDVNTQKNLEMTMKEWQEYYEDPDKTRLLNVISLEFSHTKLENYVQSPSVVRQVDWVDTVWPRQLKESQVESTNSLDDMWYPKVRKYCLMSVKNCYTDFHVDFGGTSVWYHILRGSKVFWLVPPTEKNLLLYEKWVLSGKQADTFFGDQVEKCARIYLTAGNTFFIPTGWIHAVYTPTDSLVFGGNFLHAFGIVKQLKIAQVEDQTKVPQKFRYPYFTEMLWYVLARYVYVLLGNAHLEGEVSRVEEVRTSKHIHLTHYELFGLKEIVMFLYDLPPHKKNVPDLIHDPVALIKDVRALVERHCKDSPEQAITGKPVLGLIKSREERDGDGDEDEDEEDQEEEEEEGSTTSNVRAVDSGNFVSPTKTPSAPPNNRYGPRGPYKKHNNHNNLNNNASQSGSGSSGAANSAVSPQGDSQAGGSAGNVPRRRRTRCKICEACQRSDCGECSFCQDMVKFGGPGRAKQTCMMRQCLQPMLPVTAQCVYCHLDGWRQTPVSPMAKVHAQMEGPSALLECAICYEIAHPDCVQPHAHNFQGCINEDLPNSWECPLCCQAGKNSGYKPRHFRARQKSSELRRMSGGSEHHHQHNHQYKFEGGSSDDDDDEEDNNGDNNGGRVKVKKENVDDEDGEEDLPPPNKMRMTEGGRVKQEKHDGKNGRRIKSDEEDSDANTVADGGGGGGDGGGGGGRGGGSSMAGGSSGANSSNSKERKKNHLRTQLANQIINTSKMPLKRPPYVVRPAGYPLGGGGGSASSGSSSSFYPANLALDQTCLLAIFRYLSPETLVTCALVCKQWSTVCVDPSLWQKMNCAQYKLSASLLTAIVRRQPEQLILDWTSLAKQQLTWLIARMPALKNLSLQGTPIQAVLGLHTCLCPPLRVLDLSFVRGLNDSAIRDIFSAPKDSRPGMTDSKSRLRQLKVLRVAGTDISDVALRYITQDLPTLVHLDLSSCQRITDSGVAQIGGSATAAKHLVELDLSSCKLVTDLSLDYLEKCEALTRLDLRHVPLVPTQAVIRFAANSKNDLQVQDVKLVDKRRTALAAEAK